MGDKAALRQKWSKLYGQALDFDVWGQLSEAADHYKKLALQITLETKNETKFDTAETAALQQLKSCVSARSKLLVPTAPAAPDVPAYQVDDMKLLRPFVDTLFTPDAEPFPALKPSGGKASAASAHTAQQPAASRQPQQQQPQQQQSGGRQQQRASAAAASGSGNNSDDDDDDAGQQHSDEMLAEGGGGRLLAAPKRQPGSAYLTVWVSRIGFKDVAKMSDAYLTFGLYDKDGSAEPLEPLQETPVSNLKEDSTHIVFNMRIELQTPLDRLPTGAALVFELKYLHAKKKKIVTKAWSFMEQDELKPGPIALELYEPPTDIKRKKIKLLSVKKLFLQLNLTITNGS